MAAAEMSFLHKQLEERKRRLEAVVAHAPDDASLEALLREVDSALDRFAAGTYGICEMCNDTVERDRLLAARCGIPFALVRNGRVVEVERQS